MKRRVEEHQDFRKKSVTFKKRIQELEEKLASLSDGDFVSRVVSDCPPEIHQAGLEDALAFESVDTGVSLFEGLQSHGLELPHPATLNEKKSIAKIEEILLALLDLRIVLIGFDHMSPRHFYRMLWHETLWEGCYIQRKCATSYTIMDVSHSTPKSEIISHLDGQPRAGSIH